MHPHPHTHTNVNIIFAYQIERMLELEMHIFITRFLAKITPSQTKSMMSSSLSADGASKPEEMQNKAEKELMNYGTVSCIVRSMGQTSHARI